MSRKSRTTLFVRVKVPLPHKMPAPKLLTYVKDCLSQHRDQYPGFRELQVNEITVSLEKRETVYF